MCIWAADFAHIRQYAMKGICRDIGVCIDYLRIYIYISHGMCGGDLGFWDVMNTLNPKIWGGDPSCAIRLQVGGLQGFYRDSVDMVWILCQERRINRKN